MKVGDSVEPKTFNRDHSHVLPIVHCLKSIV